MYDDEYYMREALKEAQLAMEAEEVPIGCVVVSDNGRIVGRGHNQIENLHDACVHAELIALSAATDYLNSKYLPHCVIYVTLEPCIMCAGAIGWLQMQRLVYGASDPKKGYTLFSPSPLHPKTKVTNSVLERECSVLITDFFQTRRNEMGRFR